MPGTAAGARKGWKMRRAPEKERLVKLTSIVRKAARYARLQAERTNGGYVSGLSVNLGKIEEEYVPQLGGLDDRISVFQKMGNEAKIAAVLRGNVLPLISTVRKKVIDGTQEMRDLVTQNLFREGDPRFWCETSWSQRTLEKLQSLQFGFALHGKTWDTVDGYRIFRRLTYLHPKSMGGPLGPWEWSEDGSRLVAIHRHYRKPYPSNEQVIDERIPIEDIDATVWWMTGENWEGSPLIRPMYGAWIKKDLASKIGMIALMNGGVGIPMATLGVSDGPADATKLGTMAGDLRGGSKERQYLVLKNGQKMELLTQGGAVVDARPMMQEQGLDILAAGAMDFMGQGQTASGSRAGGSVMMVAYMQQLEAVNRWLEENLNHGSGYLMGQVEEIVYRNFTPETIAKEGCPRIVFSCVSPSDQLDNVTLIVDAVRGGAVPRTLKLSNAILDRLGYPMLTQAEFDEGVGARSPVDTGTPSGAPEAAAPGSQQGRPNAATPIDRNEPRNDKMGRAFGLTAQKKTPDAGRLMKKSASYPWLR